MGKKWKQWQILFSWAPKITVDGDCSHEIKRHLLLGVQLVKESISNAGDLGSIHELGKVLGEGNDYTLQYSYLENSVDIGV